MHGQRRDAVKGLTGGIEFLFKKNKIDWLQGYAKFTSADTVEVAGKAVRAKNNIIATGSSGTPLPGVRPEERRVGTEGVSTGRSRWAPYPAKQQAQKNTKHN